MTATERKPGKRELEALEALFAQEINLATALPEENKGDLLVRLPKPMRDRLTEKGWACEDRITLGRDRFGAITVPIFCLTPLGHMLYCEHAAEGETP